jgi:ubiquinone/menaquinone biosynthesis C-methylase UbiE
LEIGCGTGRFSRLLAARSDRVLALDLSPQMVRVARERSKHCPNIDYQVADARTWAFPVERFDCVASIATLHHLPADETLHRMAEALRAGGTLIVLDLFQEEGLVDALTSLCAVPLHAFIRLVKTGRLRPPSEVRRAWLEHGQSDSYLTLSEVRQLCTSVLPGARVEQHLLWRYSIVWRKSARA